MSEKKAIKHIIKKYGVTRAVAESMLSDGVINIKLVRNALIRDEYASLYKNPVNKVMQIYTHLAAIYDVSEPHIRKLITE